MNKCCGDLRTTDEGRKEESIFLVLFLVTGVLVTGVLVPGEGRAALLCAYCVSSIALVLMRCLHSFPTLNDYVFVFSFLTWW